jgi:hypothetical protein
MQNEKKKKKKEKNQKKKRRKKDHHILYAIFYLVLTFVFLLFVKNSGQCKVQRGHGLICWRCELNFYTVCEKCAPSRCWRCVVIQDLAPE